MLRQNLSVVQPRLKISWRGFYHNRWSKAFRLVLCVLVIVYLGTKLRESESLLSCWSGYPTRKLVVCGKVLG